VRERLRELERETRAGARAELVADLRRRRDEVAAMVAQLQAAPAMAQAVEAQRAVESAVAAAIDDGCVTVDIAPSGARSYSTDEVGRAIADALSAS